MLRSRPEDLRDRLLGEAPSAGLAEVVSRLDDVELASLVRDLGGHDIGLLLDTYAQVDASRPTVIFAYTVKGRGLATEGHPGNHAAQLSAAQMAELAQLSGADLDDPWRRFAPGSDEAALCAQAAERVARPAVDPADRPSIPAELPWGHKAVGSTQAALGRVLSDLLRGAPEVAARVVTLSPDVASSTNLGGWINKTGVWSPGERRDWFADDAERLLKWTEGAQGRHIELGIAEVNLVGLAAELGATWSRWGQPLIPIATLYDPFVSRALEPWSYGIYAGGQSILVGTPSGVTLAPEGGAHQSITTPRSASNSRAASPGSRRSRRISSGACSRRWTASAGPTARRPTCACRPARSSSPSHDSPRTPCCGSGAEPRSSRAATGSPGTRRAPSR